MLSKPLKGPAVWNQTIDESNEKRESNLKPQKISIFNSTQSLKNMYNSAQKLDVKYSASNDYN
jgi:hypothetical protein